MIDGQVEHIYLCSAPPLHPTHDDLVRKVAGNSKIGRIMNLRPILHEQRLVRCGPVAWPPLRRICTEGLLTGSGVESRPAVLPLDSKP